MYVPRHELDFALPEAVQELRTNFVDCLSLPSSLYKKRKHSQQEKLKKRREFRGRKMTRYRQIWQRFKNGYVRLTRLLKVDEKHPGKWWKFCQVSVPAETQGITPCRLTCSWIVHIKADDCNTAFFCRYP